MLSNNYVKQNCIRVGEKLSTLILVKILGAVVLAEGLNRVKTKCISINLSLLWPWLAD